MDTIHPHNLFQQALPFDDISPIPEMPVKLTLREARMQLGLTQKEFAKRASLPSSTVCYYEKNKSIRIKPASTVLAAINTIREEQHMKPLSLQDIDWDVHEWNMSPENKAKMSQRVRGEGNPMYGKVGAMKGKHQSSEAKRKISEARIGTVFSKEALEKMSKAKKGKKQSEEHIRNNAAAIRGLKRSEEAKKRYSKAKTVYWEKLSVEERAERLTNMIQAGKQSTDHMQTKDTKPELAFEAKLQAKGMKLGIDYEKQYQIKSCHVDFYIFSENLVVEIYGCWWHQCEQCGHTQGIRRWKRKGIRTAEEIHNRDARRIEYLKSKGYSVQVIWQHELMSK